MQELSFQKFGSGKKIIIAFHGFGQDASLFSGWETYFQEHTIYSIDLFFHGSSTWQYDNFELEPKLWKAIFQYFLTQEGIDKFSILAFSLGGRVAITTLHFFAPHIEELWLLAPDGIKKNFWYLFATRLRTMRLMFRISIEQPEVFDNFKNVIKKTGLLNKSLVRLAENQMSEQSLRKRVYQTWLTYRHFLLRKRRISALLNQYQIPLYLFAAKHDRLVPASALEKFVYYVPHASFSILNCGHFKLPSEVLHLIKNKVVEK